VLHPREAGGNGSGSGDGDVVGLTVGPAEGQRRSQRINEQSRPTPTGARSLPGRKGFSEVEESKQASLGDASSGPGKQITVDRTSRQTQNVPWGRPETQADVTGLPQHAADDPLVRRDGPCHHQNQTQSHQ
jgi:hypothetical protein